MRREHISLGDRELVIDRPDDAEDLIDEERFERDEFMPYWAELWPSGIALARYVGGLDLRGKDVLELGCGLALPSLAAAAGGARVLATDWAPESIELVARNAAANGLAVDGAVLDWAAPTTLGERQFDLVLAADVLYEERNAGPVARLLDRAIAPGGVALIADPGRRHAPAFFELLHAGGWLEERLQVAELPGGGITNCRRSTPVAA